MDTLDRQVLTQALAWRRAGHSATLVTVVQTWGSAPRPVGALLALRGDGVPCGSVSGGCVEDDLIDRLRRGGPPQLPQVLTYGGTHASAARWRLPCGGTLRLVLEAVHDPAWLEELLARTAAQALVQRTLTLADGRVALHSAVPGTAPLDFDGTTLSAVFGPRWRLLLIGAGQLGQAVAQLGQMLGFEVLVCDPRSEYQHTDVAGARRLPGMPDDVVRTLLPGAHTAVVALTHDPKLDDLALLEALQAGAGFFYVGALGSVRSQAARRQRLAEHFGLTRAELDRLHGPVGLAIGARTPAEIAVSVAAQLVQVRSSVQGAVPETTAATTVRTQADMTRPAATGPAPAVAQERATTAEAAAQAEAGADKVPAGTAAPPLVPAGTPGSAAPLVLHAGCSAPATALQTPAPCAAGHL